MTALDLLLKFKRIGILNPVLVAHLRFADLPRVSLDVGDDGRPAMLPIDVFGLAVQVE
jgi:hypothetical protein